MKFEEYKPSSGIKCVNAFIVTGRVVPKPLPRFERWLQDLVGNWFAQRDSLNYVSRPTHFKIADDVAKEDIAHRDQLLAWWARQNKHT